MCDDAVHLTVPCEVKVSFDLFVRDFHLSTSCTTIPQPSTLQNR
jgi:hypothetical protein